MTPLPCACYKGRLHTKLNGVPREDLKQKINEVISEKRKITIESAKKKRIIHKDECEAVMVFFGELDSRA